MLVCPALAFSSTRYHPEPAYIPVAAWHAKRQAMAGCASGPRSSAIAIYCCSCSSADPCGRSSAKEPRYGFDRVGAGTVFANSLLTGGNAVYDEQIMIDSTNNRIVWY